MKRSNISTELFAQLPTDILHKILYFLTTSKEASLDSPYLWKFCDTKEAARTSILSKTMKQAWSTFPDLYFTDTAFSKFLELVPSDENQIQQVSRAKESFANYVYNTITRYQQHNIPIRMLSLTAHLQDDVKIANILEQSILKAERNKVNRIYLHMVQIPYSSLLQTIFSHRQLVSLYLFKCDFLKKDVQEYEIFINCPFLRLLELGEVKIDGSVLQKLIHSSRFIEDIRIIHCDGPKTIQVANLPHLKWLYISAVDNQLVDVDAKSLQFLCYNQSHRPSPFMLNIESTQNLKTLCIRASHIRDDQLHNLIAKCPVLDLLQLRYCSQLENIKVSSHALRFLTLLSCDRLMDIKIDAPNLCEFDFEYDGVPPSLAFISGDSGKRKSKINIYLEDPDEYISFPKLSQFLMAFKSSDTIIITVGSTMVNFDNDIINDMRENIIPEFVEVEFEVRSSSLLSSEYSIFMEGLLWSFSPKVLKVEFEEGWDDKEFVKYLFKELLLAKSDDPNSSMSTPPSSWINYFNRAKFEDRDEEWKPLHSWKSLEDVMENLGDNYILKLSHV